jgi:outer membrane protein assembly factor BamD
MASYKYADLSIPAKKKERFLVFQDDYLNFIGEYPESMHRKELDGLYEKVKEKN